MACKHGEPLHADPCRSLDTSHTHHNVALRREKTCGHAHTYAHSCFSSPATESSFLYNHAQLMHPACFFLHRHICVTRAIVVTAVNYRKEGLKLLNMSFSSSLPRLLLGVVCMDFLL